VCLEEFNIALFRNRESPRRILAPIYLYSATIPTYMKLVQYWDCRECEPTRMEQICKELIHELAIDS